MAKLSETHVFNNDQTFVEGWYWALPSKELKQGKVVGIEILGKKLAMYRGASGKVFAVDAFCPHMGAHFKEGKVEGDSIRCAFHGWKFNSEGGCSEIPCQTYANQVKQIPPLNCYLVAEHYGLIWIYTGDKSNVTPLPNFLDIARDEKLEIIVGGRTFRPCRPEVVMLNAIDAHHFNSVHPAASKLAGGMNLVPTALNRQVIRLSNQSPVPTTSWVGRLLRPFYPGGVLNYCLDYWYGSTGVVTLGPDRLKLYLMFPHRPTLGGGTEGIMLYFAKRKKGLLSYLLAKFIVKATAIVGGYFEKGDREIFESIRFSMQAPVAADRPIIEFMRHTEKQFARPLPWSEHNHENGSEARGGRA